ncbi:MAG: hypothetical protein MR697_05515, partial [Clostridiales bacterium]|nr:hypothetical protein [Clostridiales bacterium]
KPFRMKGRTSIQGQALYKSALCEADSPDIQVSGLFCVTSFRTRRCTPCAALRLSLRTLRLMQFADANSTNHKVLNMFLPQQHGKLFGTLHPSGCVGSIGLYAHENGHLLCDTV